MWEWRSLVLVDKPKKVLKAINSSSYFSSHPLTTICRIKGDAPLLYDFFQAMFQIKPMS